MEIKFLGSSEFDNLPAEVTGGSDVRDSLGFYNPHTQSTYIRWSKFPEVNKYLLDHEFNHMIEEHATDEDENGIRHKKGKDFFKHFFFPPSIITDKQEEDKRKEEEAQQQQLQQQQQTVFSNMFASPAGSQGTAGGYSTGNQLPEASGGMNQSLNQQSQSNPFASDQERFKYGAPSGRLTF